MLQKNCILTICECYVILKTVEWGIMKIDDKLKIQEFENDRSFFTRNGLDIIKFVRKKRKEIPDKKLCFYDYSGEYYLRPECFSIGKDRVYKKKQFAGEIPAEVILGYAYNLVGIPSPIAYPYFMSIYSVRNNQHLIPDGVISKDVKQIYPTAIQRNDRECHTIYGLYTSPVCNDITKEGKLCRVKETIASIAFNNKDAGYLNSFWIKDDNSGEYNSVVSIDHGYSGRDSMYGGDKETVIKGLYHIGEHGYNGMYYPEEDRATVLYFLKKLLAGNSIDGVRFADNEIKELNELVDKISKLDFRKIASNYTDRYKYDISSAYLQSLEWSREDLCQELG